MAYTTINKPSDYFNTVTYAGTGSSQSISVGFRPDLNWIKDRSYTNSHGLFDSVRNAGGTPYELRSNSTDAQSNFTGYYGSIDSTGFTVIIGGDINASGNNYVSWNWLANGAGSSNTDGSITSTVSANTTSGFSIVKYTATGSATTVGHGLGVAPSLIFVKNISNAYNWGVYHKSIGATKVMYLNGDQSASTSSAYWNDTEPTSNVFSIETHPAVNASGDNHIAYCFAEKKGFSKFGSYTGNGSADGTFIYTGFKPAFVITKLTSGIEQWYTWDNKRDLYNSVYKYLNPNLTQAEQTGYTSGVLDFVSNGFKLRNTGSWVNGSGSSFIYMAFAEHPLVSSTGVPCTAR